MSVQLDQKRLAEYNKGFKFPIQNLMADISQIAPNIVDQLIKQCMILETNLKKITDERDKLLLEKTSAKTPKITESISNNPQEHIPNHPSNQTPQKQPKN